MLLLIPFTVFPILVQWGASETLWKVGMAISGLLLAFYILRGFLYFQRQYTQFLNNIANRVVKSSQERVATTAAQEIAPKPGQQLFAVAIGSLAATAAIAIIYIAKANPNWYPAIVTGWLVSMAVVLLRGRQR
ncbi:MAG: hypothetical protein JWM58_995 [Rhizobium sp.]|nr:hypothetical protein [Rhizobium sp.]